MELGIYAAKMKPWILKFNGLSIENSTGARIVIISPRGVKTTLSFNLAFEWTNNQAKYDALVIGFEILLDLGVKDVRIIRDSQLVLRKLTREYKCNSLLLTPYFTTAIQLLDSFDNVKFEHVPRESNQEADELAQIASGVKMGEELTHNDMNIVGDWRIEFH